MESEKNLFHDDRIQIELDDLLELEVIYPDEPTEKGTYSVVSDSFLIDVAARITYVSKNGVMGEVLLGAFEGDTLTYSTNYIKNIQINVLAVEKQKKLIR